MRRNSAPRPELADARQRGYFNIGQAAHASGVSPKMIRHYEDIRLIPPADRTFTNYRIYSAVDIHTLKFIKRARTLGFSIKQIAALLSLWQDKGRSSAEVKRLALEHVETLQTKILELQAMSASLSKLAQHCSGDEHPDCPILEDLALGPTSPSMDFESTSA